MIPRFRPENHPLAACSPTDYCTSANYAEMGAEDLIRLQLRNGHTAKFHRTHAEAIGGCRFKVQGTVEATNAFGAMLEQPFTLRMTEMSDGRAYANFVSIGGDVSVDDSSSPPQAKRHKRHLSKASPSP